MKGFRAKTPGEKEQLHNFSPTAQSAEWSRFFREARRLGKHWDGCHACPPERRVPKGIVEVHHVVSQQRLKRWCRERGIQKGALEELMILTDARNSMILCESCHYLHTYRGRPISRKVIRLHAWEFIRERGLEEEILEEYPA